jgi:hypothetical protein
MWGPRRLTTLWAKEAEKKVKDCKQEMRSSLKLLNSIQSREFRHKHKIVRYISPDIRHEGIVSVMMSSFLILCEFCAYCTRLADHSGRGSKSWNIFARSNTWIVGSNPTGGMDICLRFFCLCCFMWVVTLRQGRSPIQAMLPAVYNIHTSRPTPMTNINQYGSFWHQTVVIRVALLVCDINMMKWPVDLSALWCKTLPKLMIKYIIADTSLRA